MLGTVLGKEEGSILMHHGGTSPTSLTHLLFQQSPESPRQSICPSPPHSIDLGKHKIQIKPTKGNQTQFDAFGQSTKGFFLPLENKKTG